jgi:putative sterol carrier protein
LATKEEVRKGVERVAAKLEDAELKEHFKRFSKTVKFVYPDINISYFMEISGGTVKELREGDVTRPDVVVTLDSKTFLAILNGETKALDAYSTGRIKYRGAMTDLLKLQRLL